ncbi:MAG TPA: ABC transporter substrate-binding protein, partial [Sporolactobacillaceae bacterium]|nr:ABC transporter substrate-binding protein [Sporolactobacillaceae bacterium]
MGMLDHYVDLYVKFKGKAPFDEKRETSIQAISQTLFCTDRNSKFILRKLEDSHWIKWFPGKGRGKRSSLLFLKDPEELILEEAKAWVKNGNHPEAHLIIDSYQSRFPRMKEQFDAWFQQLFGFHHEVETDRTQDVLRLDFNKLPIAPLDPLLATLRSECHIVSHVCETLVTFDKSKNQFVPQLAFFWETTDHVTWRFYLRKGISFHNGRLFTAKDVTYTFLRALKNKETPAFWMVEQIESVIEVDPYIVEFQLKTPNYFFLNLLSDEHMSILSHSNGDQPIDAHLIGTGPYKLSQNTENRLVLDVFEGYFKERPFLDRVEYWAIPNKLKAVNERTLSSTDIWQGVYYDDIHTMKEAHVHLEWNVQFLSLNLRKNGPLQNKAFREAFLKLIDAAALIRELGGDREEEANGFFPDDQIQLQMAKEVGSISNFEGERLTLFTFNDEDHIEDTEWLITRCQAHGITITPFYLDKDELLK